MKRRTIEALLRLYPAHWRREYGVELEQVLLAERLGPLTILNVLASAGRQQARIANHPVLAAATPGMLKFGMAAAFLLSVMWSGTLWQVISWPLSRGLSGTEASAHLLLLNPFEGFAVIRIGLPLLVTSFVAYPFLLGLARIRMGAEWTAARKRRATAFVLCSGGLFLLCGVSAAATWQHGLVLTLRGLEPLAGLGPMRVAAFFGRFAGSVLGLAMLVQIPVMLGAYGFERLDRAKKR